MPPGRLFAFDRRILANSLRAVLASWRDLAIFGLAIGAGVAIAHGWFAARPPVVVVAIGGAIGALAGFSVGGLIARRLAYHASDSPLAALALEPRPRRHYTARWHALALAATLLAALILRPLIALGVLPGYALGALGWGARSLLSLSGSASGGRSARRTLTAVTRRPAFAALLAVLLLAALAIARDGLSGHATTALAAVGSAAAALALSPLDHAVVRFGAIAGHGTARAIHDHSRAGAIFAAVAIVPGLIAFGPPVAAAIAAPCAIALIAMAMRVMVHRRYPRKFAETVATALFATLAVAAVSAPLLAPVLLLAALAYLIRESARATWLLA